jgi:hypothetical protein
MIDTLARPLARLCLLGLLAMTSALPAPSAQATSPLPAFRGVQQVGLLCKLDSLDGAMAAVGAAEICEFAQQRWADAFAGGPKVEIVLLNPNDERVVAPGMLVVALHVAARAGGVELSTAGGTVLAIGLGLYRHNPANDLLFGAAPEAVILSGDEDWRAELAPALTRLLFAGAAEPLGFTLR